MTDNIKAPLWPDKDKATLVRMHAEGKTNKEISLVIGRSTKAIAAKMRDMCLTCNTPKSHIKRQVLVPPKDFGHMLGIRFENVTKDEARAIAQTAPPSGKPRRQLHQSIIGCAAAMCVMP